MLAEPGATTLDRGTGNVFVADPGAGVIDVFGSSGTFITQFGEGALEASGVAVDETTGDVYVACGTALVVFKPDGAGGYAQLSEWEGANTPSKAFGSVSGVAFENSEGALASDVIVIDGANGAADVFKPKPPGAEEAQEGLFVEALKGPKLEEPNAAAVDASSGRIYVADSPKGFIAAYGPSGSFEAKLSGDSSPEGSFKGAEGEEGNVQAIAAEAGALYVAESERFVVSQFTEAGEWEGWVTNAAGAPLEEPAGVAVAPGGDLYISDALAATLDLYGPPVVVPDAQTDKATKLGKTTAILNGAVNGDGKPAKYRFAYGPTEAYGSSTPLTSTSGSGEENVTAEIQNLTPGTRYHFRLITENENGQNQGIDRELETKSAVEGLTTGPVTGIKPTEATMTGSLTPNGTDTHYDFEWGTTSSYGERTQSIDAGSGKATVAAEAELNGLAPNTTYHYRFAGSNSYGTTYGADQQFRTSGPPRITVKPATAIGHETATLHAEINPDELETTYSFQYGETTAYGTETPIGGADVGNGGTPVAVSATLSGLKLGVVYHYRVIATNSVSTTIGPDHTFTTTPAALTTGSVTQVAATEATLDATINPLGNDTTYYFQYGTVPCGPTPGDCTDSPTPPGEDIGAGDQPVTETLHLTGLIPATTYHYRVIARNQLGEAAGSEHELTTQKPAETFVLPDERAWEMVTPPDKGGAAVEALTREGGLIRAAENGERLTYVVNGPLGEPAGNRSPEMQQVLATRGVTTWTSKDIATPNSKAKGVSLGQAPEYQYFTPELSLALDEPWGGEPAPPLAPGVKQETPYLRDTATGLFTPLVTESNTAPGTMFGGHVHFVSAAPDLQHIVLKSGVALTGAGSAAGLYEWNEGALTFLSELPGGAPAPEPELGLQGRVVQNAISTIGSRVIWTNREDFSTRGGHLYLRDTADNRTVQLDGAQGVSEPTKGSALFQTADPEDSRIFFTDPQKLTPDATAAPESGTGKPDLYECEIVESQGGLGCRLKDLTVDSNEGEHAAVQGLLLGAEESASTLYFVAQGVLATNENGNGEVAEPSVDNLYMLHESSGNWTTTFIAVLFERRQPGVGGQRSQRSGVRDHPRVCEGPLLRLHELREPHRL